MDIVFWGVLEGERERSSLSIVWIGERKGGKGSHFVTPLYYAFGLQVK